MGKVLIFSLVFATLLAGGEEGWYLFANRGAIRFAKTPQGKEIVKKVDKLKTGDLVLVQDDQGELRSGRVVVSTGGIEVIDASQRLIGFVHARKAHLTDRSGAQSVLLWQRTKRIISYGDRDYATLAYRINGGVLPVKNL